ncbi:MAG: glycosyltransferase family 2 protein [Proteobacteria bacterium]|nr:glycosyltransferase family 2 protein [Pseudomonadota bacterium]HQR03424.1 glycosyltransferase family 2 protein [Rhodocyclaceae bacterium]
MSDGSTGSVNKEKTLLSVVMINFRTANLVIDCLASLLPELTGMKAKVVLVDNHSDDGSMEQIEEWLIQNTHDDVVIPVRSKFNQGFAGGNNLGIIQIQAEYYLLLNSDTLIRPGAIKILMESIGNHPRAGLVSPRLEWADGSGQESCFKFHTPFSEMILSAQTGVVSRLLSRYIVAQPVQENMFQPEWTSFACVLVREAVFDQVGLLDSGYFMYFEDVEFCHRARQSGWEIVHDPRARVVHLRGGSSSVKRKTLQRKRLPRYFYESRTRFFYQRYGRLGLTAANLMWWLGRMVSRIRQTSGRKDKVAVEYQWRDIWINWWHPMKAYSIPGA